MKRVTESKCKVTTFGVEGDAKGLAGLDREAVGVPFASAQLPAEAFADRQRPGLLFLVYRTEGDAQKTAREEQQDQDCSDSAPFRAHLPGAGISPPPSARFPGFRRAGSHIFSRPR